MKSTYFYKYQPMSNFMTEYSAFIYRSGEKTLRIQVMYSYGKQS